MTAAVVEDRTQARIDELLRALRDAAAHLRRSYARVLDVVAELDAEGWCGRRVRYYDRVTGRGAQLVQE